MHAHRIYRIWKVQVLRVGHCRERVTAACRGEQVVLFGHVDPVDTSNALATEQLSFYTEQLHIRGVVLTDEHLWITQRATIPPAAPLATRCRCGSVPPAVGVLPVLYSGPYSPEHTSSVSESRRSCGTHSTLLVTCRVTRVRLMYTSRRSPALSRTRIEQPSSNRIIVRRGCSSFLRWRDPSYRRLS